MVGWMDCDFYAVDVFERRPKSLGGFVSTRPFVSIYEAYNNKKVMNSIALQPHVADHAYIPNMKTMYVPFHMGYGNLTS